MLRYGDIRRLTCLGIPIMSVCTNVPCLGGQGWAEDLAKAARSQIPEMLSLNLCPSSSVQKIEVQPQN